MREDATPSALTATFGWQWCLLYQPTNERPGVPVGDEREGLRRKNLETLSGKTLAEELVEFAATLPEDLGPLFGRDVVRVVEQLTQERDNAWAAAEQDQLWRESLLRRITELKAALSEACDWLDPSLAEAGYVDGGPIEVVDGELVGRWRAVLSTSKEET